MSPRPATVRGGFRGPVPDGAAGPREAAAPGADRTAGRRRLLLRKAGLSAWPRPATPVPLSPPWLSHSRGEFLAPGLAGGPRPVREHRNRKPPHGLERTARRVLGLPAALVIVEEGRRVGGSDFTGDRTQGRTQSCCLRARAHFPSARSLRVGKWSRGGGGGAVSHGICEGKSVRLQSLETVFVNKLW